jgi:hypothetical protein
MSAVTRTAEARMRLVRALVRSKSTAAAAAGKPIAHIYPNSETPVKALDPRDAASIDLQRFYAPRREKEGRRLTSGADQNSQIASLAIEGGAAAPPSTPVAARTRARRRRRTHTRAPPTRVDLTQKRNAGSTPSSAATWAPPRKINWRC